jgi:hypothetical protein
MQYLVQIFSGESIEAWERLSEPEQEAVSQEYYAISSAPGVIGGAQLQPPATATTIRVQDGRTLTTDGPFAELKEAIGGYFVLEAENLDEAIAIAASVPAARLGGAVEVRPVQEW